MKFEFDKCANVSEPGSSFEYFVILIKIVYFAIQRFENFIAEFYVGKSGLI